MFCLSGRVRTNRALRAALSASLAVTLLASCARYQADPLTAEDESGTRPQKPERIAVDRSALRLPELTTAKFDPSDGLNSTEIAILAVSNNPDLKLARDDLHIAQAQAFDAGLLPDPQISLYQDAHAPAEDATRAFTYGLSVDLAKIVARSTGRHAANADTRKTDLALLWQEWQVVAQARTLYAKIFSDRLMLPQARQQVDLNRSRYERFAGQLDAHQITSDLLVPALVAYTDAQKAYSDMARQATQNEHDLNDLLGLAADSVLNLQNDTEPAVAWSGSSGSRIDAVTGKLLQHRPDLLALKAGYEAEDYRYRGAILAQFPGLTFGWQRARDNSNVYTGGPLLGLSLPLFNRNRGQIAIEKATRQRLHDEYRIRIAQAYADLSRINADMTQLHRQIEAAQTGLTVLQDQADAAEQAYQRGSIVLSVLTDARLALLSRQQALAAAVEALKEQQIARDALLGPSHMPRQLS